MIRPYIEKACRRLSKRITISLQEQHTRDLFLVETRCSYKSLSPDGCCRTPLDVCSYVLPDKVTYKGASVVHENQPWSIECSDLKPDDMIRWTRNGQSLEPELASGQLTVQSPVGTGSSTLRAMHATDSHHGDYKCTQDSDELFHLWINFGSYMSSSLRL